MIKSLLIANRGEIACRIIRTAKKLGIRTISVYSEADANALHVRMADEAVLIGPAAARESYLVGDKIIAAAKETGAEAIHPGYGFLSENAGFAQAVQDAGIIWVGPNPASITAMGLKDAAKKLMQEAGVPVTPGYLGDDQSNERLQAEADRIGYPVLIKAVAGGGGKGMRRVDAPQDFPDALLSCQREAAASFGNDVVLIEKYILSPRHIEVQVFGDAHGNIVHLFERDCSLQRRHQKVIEEAPAPGMDAITRAAVCEAAVNAARAVDYVGAGTIEFIADASEGLKADRIWFMEMNTRLQVEHPVTEEITGQDLVEWQLRVASGEPLPKKQDELSINGHAIEARLYAEDPSKGFLPSIGRLEMFKLPLARTGLNPRYDMGVNWHDEVTPFYDPMLGKIIVHAQERWEAIDQLAEVCERTVIWPVATNLGFVARALKMKEFRAAEIDTGFIDRHADKLLTANMPLKDMAAHAADELKLFPKKKPGRPWRDDRGFRLNGKRRAELHLIDDHGEVHHVDLTKKPKRKFKDWGKNPLVMKYGGDYRAFRVYIPRGNVTGGAGDGSILSPMPGKIIAIAVAPGDKVVKGQKLLTLEAMKMEHSLTAPFDGVVAELNASEGGQVQVDTLLVKVEAEKAV